MIKSELITKVATLQQHLTDKDVELCVNTLLETMSRCLCEGGRIEIRGFGSFNLHYHPPRNAHNPKTGVKVVTLPKYTPHFKPGKEMRDRVNESRHTISIKQDDTDADTSES